MSGQLKNNTRERKLRVTLLSAEWKASSNGDLTTINRELAIQMAKHPNVEVSVLLPQCSEEDKRDADSYNVKLIEAVKLSCFEPVDWLASLPDGHAMDCVLGHGVALGRQIQIIKKNPNYSHCKWIQVVHTAPEEIGMYKNISEGQKMQQREIELCKMADQVVTIGPKLTDAYKRQLREQDVLNLTPSIFTEFSDVQQASNDRRKFCVLVTESGDSEDFDVKGYGIAAKAIAILKGEPYQLKFASKQRGKEDELKHKLLQCGIDSNQLIISSFDENRKMSANLLSTVDMAILPSKTDGFGLSALEAISAGLPVLVSGNSGIAEALRKVPYGSQCIVESEDPADWARAIKAVHYRERNVRLEEAKILHENYLKKFSWKEPCGFLVEKMCNLTFGGKMNIKVDVAYLKPEEQNMQTGILATPGSVGWQEVQQPGASATSAASGSMSCPQTEDLQTRKVDTFLSIIKDSFKNTNPQSIEDCNWFKEFTKEMKAVITDVSEGSLVITVRCESLMILEELWTDYLSGRLGEVVQNCFVTEKILKELNLAELRLKTTIDIEEYNACKMFFEKDALRGGLSHEFHSTSSTSESPPPAEKSEQKTKIMETVKLEGTSPLTVVPTTGHGKELEEPWGRKAVPSSSFSTTNLGEKAIVSQPHFIKSTEGWQKQEELKRWEQKIETVQLEKFEGKMASAVAPSFHSTKETINYARLCRLLADVSAHILRETFDKRRPTGDLHTVLSSPPVHAVLQSLRKKRIISPLQWGKLYPAIKSAVSSKNFDITLLMVLLRNICGLVRPATGWDTLPPATDATIEADIVRIKCCRNTVYGHASQASVDDPTFNQYWQDIQDALVRLGGAGYQSAIDDLRKECMDPDFEEHYKELLKQWVVDEVSIKERLDEMTEHFGRSLDELKEAIVNPAKKFKAGEKEDESEWRTITELGLRGRKVTDTGVASLCQALQTPTCEVTRLNLSANQITDAGVASLCQALLAPSCEVTLLSLAANQITDAGVASLCQALQTPTCKVSTLYLGCNQITDAGVASLCQALQTPTCKVTTLFLNENQITDAGVASLCQALQTPTCKVTDLNLKDNQVTDTGVASLCQALQTPTCKVTMVNLGDNQITNAGVASLCQALQTPKCRVTTLHLDSNQITDTGVASLCQALQTPTCKVTDLSLEDNLITDAGVASLCQALQTPTCKVTTLSLNKNQITDAGVSSLCQALQTLTCKVTGLGLADIQITDDGVASLCQALQTPTCKVTDLGLEDNQITDAGVASLCEALQTPTCKVTMLYLGCNQITDAGAASLCQALQTPTCKVTDLDLASNRITDAGVASLCEALQTPTCQVTTLYLNKNQITDAGVASLCQALQTPTCKVTDLELVGNQITDAGVASLRQASQTAACKVLY